MTDLNPSVYAHNEQLVSAQSPETAEINAALAKVQGEIGKAHKKHTGQIQLASGGSYKFQYADLGTLIDLTRENELLEKNGISVQARPIPAQGGIRVQTVLRHSSGQWLADGAPFLPVSGKNPHDPKLYGSLISYLRRYGLAAMLNIAQSDNEDDLPSSNAAPKTTGKKTPNVKLAPIDKRDELLARIKALPEELQSQIGEKLRKDNVVWTQLSTAQLKTTISWVEECEDIANASL